MNFTVKNIPIVYKLSIVMVCIFAMMLILYTITESQPHIVMYIVFLMFIIPLLLTGICFKRYFVTVNKNTIIVQNGLSFKPFVLDVSDIVSVSCVVSYLFGDKRVENYNMKIYARNGKKFNVESLMINSNKMFEFIKNNVSEEKIKYINNPLNFEK